MSKSNTCLSLSAALAAANLTYVHDPDVIHNGGGRATSSGYVLDGAVGQAVVGVSSSPDYIGAVGFLSSVSTGGGGTEIVHESFAGLAGWTIVSGLWGVQSGALAHTGPA